MNALLVCCTPCVCDSRIILDTNAIWITLIICVTIITTILGLVLFYNNYKKLKKITDLENEKQQLKDNLSKNEDDLKKAKESLETFPEFETIKCIRHPANGGKADFVKGLKTYLI